MIIHCVVALVEETCSTTLFHNGFNTLPNIVWKIIKLKKSEIRCLYTMIFERIFSFLYSSKWWNSSTFNDKGELQSRNMVLLYGSVCIIELKFADQTHPTPPFSWGSEVMSVWHGRMQYRYNQIPITWITRILWCY